ncbi:PREDICTED: E3 ubiquitin-protein ligase UPL3-like [Camelina sativa]|uniref:HECT-type E3 ubiquitin transferase n=1 Tax=Camelina sativa TaxID=90675 RepID=A0ABM0U736_CAMSA|nr:PREDICTED: E3 ubiquitin-protein ligase UPL3-like [Camelina sativa]
METRSRKRAEATSTAPSSSSSLSPSASSSGPATRSKRARLSSSSSSSLAPSSATTTTRSRSSRSAAAAATAPTPMDTSTDSSGFRRGGRGNRGNDNTNSDKGKEKEHDVRIRERDRAREQLNMDAAVAAAARSADDDDDDNDSEDGNPGFMHPNMNSASSALQGLLRKLGAGLDDLLPSSGIGSASSSHLNGRMKKILSGLRSEGEEGKQVEALTQLCEMLSIGTEDSLSTFSVDSFVPVLVGLLNHESNPDIMLLAARALTHLCDVLPSSCAAVVHYGAVSCLVARLLTIEYMDLAEQSLQALKKISQEHPTACLRAGALMAVLSYLDFFSTGVQRVALSTAANMCKKLPSDASDYVMEAVPLLTNLLQYHDSKVLEYASICLTRIAEAFAPYPEKLDELCNHGLVTQAASLISTSNSGGGGQASLSVSTYTGLIRLLSTCASGSPLGFRTLLLLGISSILKDILLGSGVSANASVSPALSRPADQIFEIVNLANELLPPLPEGVISLPTSSNTFVKGSSQKKSCPSTSGKQEDALKISPREKLLGDQPELLKQFGLDLLPVLVQIYGSSVNGTIRHKCLSVIGKLMYFSSSEVIQSLIGDTNISSFLAGVLAWKDPQVLVPALQVAEILMEKLPETFSKVFVREGVVHAVDQLVLVGKPSHASPTDKENDCVPGSARSRRYRRRSSNANSDGNQSEEPKNSASVNIGANSLDSSTASFMLRETVSSCAKAFKDKYFPSDGGDLDVGVTDDLLHLKNLCKKLTAGIDDHKVKGKGKSKASGASLGDFSASKEEYLIGIISEILAELSKGDGVSTFEFVGSGVVAALLNYFSCGYFSKEKISELNFPKLRQEGLRRFKAFLEVALPFDGNEGKVPPMTVLIQKLQNALSSLERFPVVLSHPSRSLSGSARLSSGLSALAHPLKLRLCRAPGEKTLRDYSSNIVLIDPLASMAAVEEFLWPRVQRSESGLKPAVPAGNTEAGALPSGAGVSSPSSSTPASTTRRHSSRSRSAINIGDTSKKDPVHEKGTSSSKGKGKGVMKPAQADKVPQTRNSAQRRAVLDKDTQMKPPSGDSSSEDEELDISPVDIDDALVIEEDDISDDEDDDNEDVLDDSLPMCTADKVHDVKLADSVDDDGLATSGRLMNPASGGTSGTAAAAARGSDSTDAGIGNTYGSRGALSFAAAAMAGLGAASGRGIRGSRDLHGRTLYRSSDEPSKLIFTAGGKQLSRHLTIYQAVQRQLMLDEDDDDRFGGSDLISSDGSRFNDIYTIMYQRPDSQVNRLSVGGASSTTPSKSTKSATTNSSVESQSHKASLLDSILQGELPCDLEKSNSTYNVLALLRVLEGLNQLCPRLRAQTVSDRFAEGKIASLDDLSTTAAKVPHEEFVNSKLTPKLARQIQDALALCSGSLPSWCYQLTRACPFLFPFQTRRQYFYSTAFGLSRALNRLQQQQGADGSGSTNEREMRIGRLQRQKVRVSRNRILDSAAKVMEMYSSQKAVLEVEYFGEVGTGLGPTLEFYTLLSHDLQKVALGMWRSNSGDKVSMQIDRDEIEDGKSYAVRDREIVQAPLGLFPRPWPSTADVSEGGQFHKVIEYFRLLGRVMAKALQDGRLLDVPLSTAFYKLLFGQELDLHDIVLFDAELGKTLQELRVLVARKHYLEAVGGGNGSTVSDLCLRGSRIEDLCLDFTLPGYPEYILRPGDEIVDITNLEEYISLVVDATVKRGVARQIDAFRSGFNQVFDITSLQIFTPSELDYLLCGRRELWEAETLTEHIKFDHGYTAKSPAIINLLEIMGELTADQQRAFCQFVTGAPRLPPGGLAVLNPKLTIVRKHSSTSSAAVNGAGASETADDDLPSVMTCANYLKLPPYSTKEIMYKKLLYAINEGQGSFDLS